MIFLGPTYAQGHSSGGGRSDVVEGIDGSGAVDLCAQSCRWLRGKTMEGSSMQSPKESADNNIAENRNNME